MKRIYAAALVLMAVGCSKPEATSTNPVVDGVDILVLTEARPLRWRLRVVLSDEPVGRRREAFFRELFAFLDRDSDGRLSATEAARAPTPATLRQWANGFFRAAETAAPVADGPPAGPTVADVAHAYRAAGLGDVLVATGRSAAAARLSAALAARLDVNKDGKLSISELLGAEKALAALDADGDELIAAAEVVGGVGVPYPHATALLTPTLVPEEATVPTLPFVVIVSGQPASAWREPLRRRYGQDFATVLTDPSAFEIEVRLPEDAAPTTTAKVPPVPTTADGGVVLTWPDGRADVRGRAGRLAEVFEAHRRAALAAFAELDADRNGVLDIAERKTVKRSALDDVLALADRDGDGQVTQVEWAAVLDLQRRWVASHALVGLVDHGRGLFEALDADRDGRLSLPELRGARRALLPADAAKDASVDLKKLPRQWSATVSRGSPLLPGRGAAPPARVAGPAWFRGMDVNGDGVVSRAEFLGTAAQFDRLDVNKDGVLSAEEATR